MLSGSRPGHFGCWTDIQGDTAVAAEPDQNVGSHVAQGYVYVYHRDTDGAWTQTARLTSANGQAGDSFGQSVGLAGNTMVVGAWHHARQSGAVYVFQRSAAGRWTQVADLTGSGEVAGDFFGWAVAIHGGQILVGAPYHDGTGAVYSFVRRDGRWRQAAVLRPSGLGDGANLGRAVSLDGQVAVAGAPGPGTGAPGSGYVFGREPGGRWAEIAHLRPGPGTAGNLLGWSATLLGPAVVLGAPGQGAAGAVYVFTRRGGRYAEQAELDPAPAGSAFGYSAAAATGLVLIGAQGQDHGQGRAYLYRDDGTAWRLVATLTAGEPVANGFFGQSVALDGQRLMIGADGDGNGAAFIFGRT
jgi:FG-GAP repeat